MCVTRSVEAIVERGLISSDNLQFRAEPADAFYTSGNFEPYLN